MKLFWNFVQSTAVLCANFQNNLIAELDVRHETRFHKIRFRMSFRGISHIATSLKNACLVGGWREHMLYWCHIIIAMVIIPIAMVITTMAYLPSIDRSRVGHWKRVWGMFDILQTDRPDRYPLRPGGYHAGLPVAMVMGLPWQQG